MNFLIWFDTFLGRRMTIGNSTRAKKDSICHYTGNILTLVVLKTGQVEFSFNSLFFTGFLLGSAGKSLIFEKSRQALEKKKEVNGYIFLFQKKKLTNIYKKKISKKNGRWLNQQGFSFLEKSIIYLLDRKKTILNNKNSN